MSRRFLAATLCVLAACASLLAPRPAQADIALLIGIGRYQNPQSNLAAPAADVRMIAEFLLSTGRFQSDEILVLTDEKATQENILIAMAVLVKESQPGDDVFLYYSGHGSQVDDLDGDEGAEGQDEALVPYDYAANLQAGPRVVIDDNFEDLLDLLADRNVTIIVDACHSGTISRSLERVEVTGEADSRKRAIVLPGQPDTLVLPSPARASERTFVQGSGSEPRKSNHMVWTAAAPNQYSWEDGRLGHGVFSYYFVRGHSDPAADANGNGIITSAELIDYVRNKTETWCTNSDKCQAEGLGFTPALEGPKTLVQAQLASAGQSQQQQPVEQVPPQTGDGPPLLDGDVVPSDILGTQNSAGLSVAIEPSARVRANQSVAFRVRAQRDGWLVLLFVDAKGRLMQVYPNQYAATDRQRWNWVRAGAPLTVPDAYYGFEFRADPNAIGPGQLIALHIEDEVALQQLLRQHAALQPVPDAGAYLAQLADALRRMQAGSDGVNRPTTWSVAYAPYEVLP